jgi:DNA-binding transcriptional MerR regulator/methylmalonyl-CoA mutase cobalamin-binding subunit
MYNIKMLVKLLGLSAGTIRAWETRYSVVNPARSDGGHRLYSDQDVEDLRWLKVQTEGKGISISQAAQLLKKKKGQQEQAEINPLRSTEESSSNFLQLQNNLYAHLIDFEAERSNALVDLGFSLYPFDDMFHQVLVPLMTQVGDEWEQGKLSVTQEHFISHFVHQRFTQFFRLFLVDPRQPKVIALCPPGEHHQAGLLLFSLFLRRRGLDVIYLGANTPNEGIIELIREKNIDILCVSLTDPTHLASTLTFIEQIQSKVPQLLFVLGGKGFDDLPSNHQLRTKLIGNHMEGWVQWFQQEISVQ